MLNSWGFVKTLFETAQRQLRSEVTNNLTEVSLKMVLIAFLLFMTDHVNIKMWLTIIAVPGLLFKPLVTKWYYWAFIAALCSTWYLASDLVRYVPNHKHVYAYTALAILVVLVSSKKEEILGRLKDQATYIIALCFLFSTIGKFLAPEFLNGTFMVFTSLTDLRFFGMSSLLGDLDFQILVDNFKNLNELITTNDPNNSFVLKGVDNLGILPKVIVYWTILIEGAIAICFCIPRKYKISKYRNLVLIAFILTTYPIATVTGFAIILVVLGFIQSIENKQITKYSLFYLLVFILLPLLKLPFKTYFSSLF